MGELTRSKYLLEDEEAALRRALVGGSRDVLVLELLLYTGARAGEILQLVPSDLNWNNRSVYLRGTKKSRDREIPLPRDLYSRLVHLVPGKGARLFPFGYDNLRRIWLLYRPVDKGLHSLRHTAAINLYKKTRDIKLVQLFLGHRSLTNTQIYTEFVYSQEALRSVLCPENSLSLVQNSLGR